MNQPEPTSVLADTHSPSESSLPSPEATSTGRGVSPTKKEDRPLILYAYSESEFARVNLKFFLDHGLHSAADFIFILNGETDVDKLIFPPADINSTRDEALPIRSRSNVLIKRRNNFCFDLGAHAEVLNSVVGGAGWFNHTGPIAEMPSSSSSAEITQIFGPNNESLKFRDRYKAYILMNASIRGPFAPTWSTTCWSDAYLNKVTERVKLVGMSYNCHKGEGHLQSMIWATDAVGIDQLLKPDAIGTCPPTMDQAQESEIRTTTVMRNAGYEVDAFLSVYHSRDKAAKSNKLKTLSESAGTSAADLDTTAGITLDEPGDFWKGCIHQDFLQPNKVNHGYYGTFVHPYENFFMKSNRHIEDTVLDLLTDWHDGMGYESYDFCH